MNLAENAEAFKANQHPGYVESAWEGLRESIEAIEERGIKVVINGGSINPSGLASKVSELVCVLPPPSAPTPTNNHTVSPKRPQSKSRLRLRR